MRCNRVDSSGLALQRLRLLARQAAARGDGPAFAAALRRFHRRLEQYPPFGDPSTDLVAEPGPIRLGIIRPLSLRYAVHAAPEETRELVGRLHPG